MIRNVAVLGAGGMGTALALLLAPKAESVRIWCRDDDRANRMEASRRNERHLPEAVLPVNVRVTSLAGEATKDVDWIVAAIPSSFLRSTLALLSDVIPGSTPILSVVKGIENQTFARPSEILREVLGDRPVLVLSGPSHAEEIARGQPASVVVAGDDESRNLEIRDALNSGTFRVYTNSDVVGVELAGALKNVLGVAAGICDGLDFGDNAKAALLTRGLIEIARFSCEMGAKPSTFLGLAGVGDVITTCYSPFGRNRAVGRKIGQGMKLDKILQGMTSVAEGVATTQSVHSLAMVREIDMPITAEVYQVLFEGKPPRAAVIDLMQRLPKVEWP